MCVEFCYLLFLTFIRAAVSSDPSTRVVLPQGILSGVRMQTERRVIVTAYLGIPYALPPLGPYRFAAPERHPGWNDSLVAEHYRPDCLQPRQSVSAELRTTSEDCLYLNVFVPAGGTLNRFPVVTFFEGSDYVSGSPRSVEAQELSAEGVIVVTASYRMNVFGFLCLGDANGRGNLGLLDQYLALLWVRENTPHFGGLDDITVMGHGAGASAVVAHLTSPRTRGLFTRAIIMSGSALSPIYQPGATIAASSAVARSLGCRADPRQDDTITILTCLRQKPAEELLRAFENVYRNANWTSPLVPLADIFLPERMQYIPVLPADALQSGNFLDIPIMAGITVNEGTVLLERWQELRNQPEASMVQFINNTAIPNMLNARGLSSQSLSSLLEWKYLHDSVGPPLAQLIQLYTDAIYSAPHWQQLQHLARSAQPVFAYRFLQYKGVRDGTSGAHGSELPFLFGPLRRDQAQWQSANGRSPSFAEDRLSLRMKRLWTTFMRTGDPNPSASNSSRVWPAFSGEQGAVLELFGDPSTGRTMELPAEQPDRSAALLWNQLLPALHMELKPMDAFQSNIDVFVNPGDCGPYKSAMFTTLSFLILLIAALILALVLLKRHLSAGRQLTKL